MTKKSQSEELQRLVDEYLEGGGEIQKIPEGVSKYMFKTINNKRQLYSLSNPTVRAKIPNIQRKRIIGKGGMS